ncbi:malate dehydrogenase (quinone) [Gluconobacter kanchanaburiensis]|uniref:Probable malate:quinone oxidoreductase n=1 Tax=Gluconobacter kanchanaburiensis NBRC 103587 TaxID=1307948 RepID=A0A511B6W5_9PROT|nr:malate dehydrogenase (quinone) [Gluconobacter kanchanaburiensis]MBF0860544.1 malate dehydrogenase (quinone) [Gluconobacter kanchanaburiensis]GBR69331.1 malate:quinone oxidoreductase [Gluconobacter kanchanaburiensis NBRC 103587]GEK96205.1 putative malate:quinone oxidoreductase [Gluconobacter kanchanaburiensis NBRC 103587]
MPSVSSLCPDIVLIGAGIMSTTLAALLRDLDPSLSMIIFETLADCGQESSYPWNNAGTGHAGNCELNYTPQRADGTVDISKALAVNTEFDLSRQLWSHWIRDGRIADPGSFVQPCPHISLVWGAEDVAFLKARYDAMVAHHCFANMEYTDNPDVIAQWAPLVMAGRDTSQPVAATRIREGTDVNFGALTHLLTSSLKTAADVSIRYTHRVTDLTRTEDGRWRITATNTQTGETVTVLSRTVFVGAGGNALPLLQKAGIPEVAHHAGFPVSGLWLRCDNPDITQQHHAKVYGKAPLGSPPMSVPHLDTRVIDGKSCLLFGPYAGFSTKFLRNGSWTDYFRSLTPKNIVPALTAGKDNLVLVDYLVRQVLQSGEARFDALCEVYPTARSSDWSKVVAGQRVQIIRPEKGLHGTLRFGTEIVESADRSIIAVLGASPGASIAASIALKIVQSVFSERFTDMQWLARLKQIFPSWGIDLTRDAETCRMLRDETARVLKITPTP